MMTEIEENTFNSSGNNNRVSTLLLIIFIAFLAATPVIVMPLMAGALIDTLAISPKQAGIIVAAEMAGYGSAALFLSLKVHVWNRRVIMFTCLSTFLLMSIASLLTNHWALLGMLRFISGLGGGGAVATVKAALANTDNPDRSFGLYLFLTLAFAVVSLPVFSLVIANWTLTGAYILFALLIVFALVASPYFPLFKKTDGSPVKKSVGIDFKRAWPPLAAMLIYFVGQAAVWTNIERFGVSLGIDSVNVGGMLGLAHISGGVGAAIVTLLGAKYGRKYPVIIGITIVFSSVLLLSLKTTHIAFVLAIHAFTFAVYFTTPYFFGLISALDLSGRIVVLGLTVQSMGMAIGPAIAGLLVVGESYSLVQLLGMFCFICSLIVITPFLLSHDRSTF